MLSQVADIAAAACVTIRAVQLAFRRHLDTTPTAYLRRVRLGHAHEELRQASPGGVTVAEVAYRWGFATHSDFTACYRQAYGVTPATPCASADGNQAPAPAGAASFSRQPPVRWFPVAVDRRGRGGQSATQVRWVHDLR